jgi:hypothetical protein
MFVRAGGGDAKAKVSRIRVAGADLWVAEQIAKTVESCGAETFLDRRDIAAGDNFRRRIRQEMPKCDELLALFTPWSRRRAWVRHEIGMADMLSKRIVCVFYQVTMNDFDDDEDGRDLNVVDINALHTYLRALSKRVR